MARARHGPEVEGAGQRRGRCDAGMAMRQIGDVEGAQGSQKPSSMKENSEERGVWVGGIQGAEERGASCTE